MPRPGTDEPRWYYWEILETWKKIYLVGFATLIYPGRVLQLGISMVFVLVFMLCSTFAEPCTPLWASNHRQAE